MFEDCPLRSALYVPAAQPRLLEKAAGLPVDALIFDWEDAVAPSAKAAARAALAAALAAQDYRPRLRLLRVNGAESPALSDDLAALPAIAAQLDGLVLPKAEDPVALSALAAKAQGLPLWALIETPRGVLRAEALADHPAVAGLIMGSNDLSAALRLPPGPDQRQGLLPHLAFCLLAARAAGKPILDGVFNALGPENDAAFSAECLAGRALGFDGKTLIHPGQIGPTHAAFNPSAAERAEAEALTAAFAKAEAAGEGVALFQGRMIEALHARAAEALLRKAAAAHRRETNKGMNK